MKTGYNHSFLPSFVLVSTLLICCLLYFGCGDNCRDEYPCNHGDWNGDNCNCDCAPGWHGVECDQQNINYAANRITADVAYKLANGTNSTFAFNSDTLNVIFGDGPLYDSITADGFYAGDIAYMYFFIEVPDLAAVSSGDKFPIRNYQTINTCWHTYYHESAAADLFYPMVQNLKDTIYIDEINVPNQILHAHFASELINGYNDSAFITNGKILYN